MLAKHDSRNHLVSQERWLCALLFQTLLGVLACEVDFVLGKGRMKCNVSHQIKNLVSKNCKCRSRECSEIGAGSGVQCGAHLLDFFRNLATVASVGAFGEQ